MVYSHLMPTGEPHVAFRPERIRPTPVVGAFPYQYGIIALTYDAVRFFSKGGVMQAEVSHPELEGVCAGVLATSARPPTLAMVTAPENDGGAGSCARLCLLDLMTSKMSSSLDLERPATIVRFEPFGNLLILGGTDGTILTYDMRTPKRSCLQSHIFPRGVICDFDVCGNTVVASSMRSQLNPFGQHQWTLDPNLRAADIRSARVGANIFFEPGAAKLRFHPAVPSSVIAASAEGELRVLDSSGAMTAPSTLTLGGVLERGAQLCALTISSTGQLLAAADSSGALDICGTASLPAEELQVNALSQPTESADLAEPLVPLSWESPVGGIPLFEEEEEVTPAALASDWPSKLLAKRGARTLEPEELLRSLKLAPHQTVQIGSASALVVLNGVGRAPNTAMPPRPRGRAPGELAEAEPEEHLALPPAFRRYKRLQVPIGKFGLAEDFSFEEHNHSARLCALDNTVPNNYCNPVLLLLHGLPWVRVHCLSSLSRSQFLLTDELGFLFHMMEKSGGGCCQPRNFQRALIQSREASALKLLDAVDIEGNRQGSATLPELICKFSAFLLEQLNKEARDTASELRRNAETQRRKDDAEAKRREVELLTGASHSAGGKGGKKGDRPSMDAIVAQQYAARLAGEAGSKEGASGASGSPGASGADAAAVGGGGGGGGVGSHSTLIDRTFEALWREVSEYPGSRAKPASREVRSLLMTLAPPEAPASGGGGATGGGSATGGGGATGGAAGSSSELAESLAEPHSPMPSFAHVLNQTLCVERRMRTWCEELKSYRQARVRKEVKRAPNCWLMPCERLDASAMEQWEGLNGIPWIPTSFKLVLPQGEGGVMGGEGDGSAANVEEGAAQVNGTRAPAAIGGPTAVKLEAVGAKASLTLGVAAAAPPQEGAPEGGGLNEALEVAPDSVAAVSVSLELVDSVAKLALSATTRGAGGAASAPSAAMADGVAARARVRAARLRERLPFVATHGEPLPEGAPPPVGYSLRGVVSFSQSTNVAASEGSGHFVLSFRVPVNVDRPSNDAAAAAAEEAASFGARAGQWYVWNDFDVSAASEAEVLRIHATWKRPCVLLYSRDDCSARLSDVSLSPTSPVAAAAELAAEFSLSEMPPREIVARGITWTPLRSHEMPRAGMVVAIDAEFVAVSHEVTRPGRRGKTIVVKPARLALARVSCLRGEGGMMAGVPFLDSCIQQAEPVVDYLTRYSGLQQGEPIFVQIMGGKMGL